MHNHRLLFMDDSYLIEIRLARTKWRIRKKISLIGRLFSLEGYIERHPHVTLFGPLNLNEGVSPRQLLDAIGKVTDGRKPVPFTIEGWEFREGMHGSVIAFRVRPSESLKNLTASVAESVSSLVHSQNTWDSVPQSKWFHITIANRLNHQRASGAFSVLTGQPQETPRGILQGFIHFLQRVGNRGHAVRPVLLDEHGLRLTVMKGEEIFAEFDFLENRWITGDYSHNGKNWQKTLTTFREKSGFEQLDPRPSDPEDIFLISDLHLGHANIIRYCSRPFLASDVKEMDHVLIKNWNYTVSPANRVFYLGDLRYGKDAFPALHYRKKLKGNITFIGGNHDNNELDTIPSLELKYRGYHFLLVHDPSEASEFDGWVIHGHHHNNDLSRYPFINFEQRRINVSAEVVGYIPVNLNHICTLIDEHQSRGDTTPLLLNYPYTAG
jgi:calcineurin-like phosphoesterase family protein